MKLLTHYSTKLDKSQNDEYLNAILYLEPSYNYTKVCPNSTPACRKSCLVHSGRMKMKMSYDARYRRTELYMTNPKLFKELLSLEIEELQRKAYKQSKKLVIRLNGTSDIDWSDIYESFPTVQFYEYTKVLYSNVHSTVSRSEKTTLKEIKDTLALGINVAVIFEEVPKSWYGFKVINGDLHDRRFEDPKGVIVGLKLKGTNKAKELALVNRLAIRKD